MNEPSKQWDMNNANLIPSWVIHKTWAGGNTARVLFFTRDQGMIWAQYYGGWGAKKQAILQAFMPLWGEWKQRQSWFEVRHLEIAGHAFEFVAPHLFSALYLNELLYHALRPQDPYPDLYDAYVTTLQHLSLVARQSEVEQILRRFEWTVLTAIGYSMSLTHDAYNVPINLIDYYHFQPGLGLLPASIGLLGADILALAHDDLTDPQVLKTAKHLMRQALSHALGGKIFKSRDFFKPMVFT